MSSMSINLNDIIHFIDKMNCELVCFCGLFAGHISSICVYVCVSQACDNRIPIVIKLNDDDKK